MHIDLVKVQKVFFIGIGGIGISAIARMMHQEGKVISGSDMQRNTVIEELEKIGIAISFGQGRDLIPSDTDLIIYTIALEVYDPALLNEIKSLSIPTLSYPEALEAVTKDKYTIAVSGTHGKTTTTAMIGHVLQEAGKDPSMIVGSLLVGSKSNFVQGSTDLFVVEACEYKRSFLHISPKILVITNIDEDHLDYYKDIEDIENAFNELAKKVPENGVIIADKNDKRVERALRGVVAPILDYKSFLTKRVLKIPGVHNQLNASAAASVCHYLSVDTKRIDKALESFPGTWRRFEERGILSGGAKIYDDYAHHPKEVETTLKGFRELYAKPFYTITVLFQPHLFSRTKAFLEDFSKAFNEADRIIILPIFPAREVDDGTISAEILAQKIRTHKEDVASMTFEEAIHVMQKMNFDSHDIIVTMGAGEAYKIGDTLLGRE